MNHIMCPMATCPACDEVRRQEQEERCPTLRARRDTPLAKLADKLERPGPTRPTFEQWELNLMMTCAIAGAMIGAPEGLSVIEKIAIAVVTGLSIELLDRLLLRWRARR